MIEELKELDEGIVISGDGRHDSMGHSAKYCSYTIFCCTKPSLVHFNLVQVHVNVNTVIFVRTAKMCNSFTIYLLSLSFFIFIWQRNEAGSSQAMEYLAFQKCMEFLFGKGLTLTTLVTDRHLSIQKHMKESSRCKTLLWLMAFKEKWVDHYGNLVHVHVHVHA